MHKMGIGRIMLRNLAWAVLGLMLSLALSVATSLVNHPGAGRVSAWISPWTMTPAAAAEPTNFTAEAFQAAQQAGKPILIHVNASWCPTCAQQRPILDKFEHSAELGDLTVFTVDFDSQKDVLREFNVQQQSTLIVFNGKTEKGRATGITDPDDIHALLVAAKQP